VFFKRTEASFGVVSFGGFEGEGTNVISIPFQSQINRTIEFLGDSLTCAYGNLGLPNCTTFSANTEDATLSFVTLAAQILNVNSFHIECWSGKGVVRNYGWNGTTSPDPFPIYFNRTLGNEPSSIWNFKTYSPSAVAVTLGANDYSTQPNPSFEQFYEGYSALLDNIFQVYSSGSLEHVFAVCGPLSVDPCHVIERVVAKYNSSSVTFISLANILSEPSDYGCNGHPSAQGDQKVSVVLASQIQAVLNW